MLEVSQMNAKNLREEVLIRAKTMAEQGETIQQLKAELVQLKTHAASQPRQGSMPDRLLRYVDEFAQETDKLKQETSQVVKIMEQRSDFNRINEEQLFSEDDD